MVMFGAMATVEVVWSLADLFMGLMAILNLFAIAALGNIAFKVLQDFVKQRKKGLNPVFKASSIKELKNAERSEEHKSELKSRFDLVCRLLLDIKKMNQRVPLTDVVYT